jgi:aspartyl-tRNA(Asn)/glutamyl-tRNA(Gln) amidotransferase subunit A
LSSELVFKPIHELCGLIRTGRLSPRELTSACLAHIAAVDGRLGAFAELWADEALATAAAQETAIKGGQYLGPLHGIPVAFKDMIEVAGRRTTGGAGIWRDRRSTVTSDVYKQLIAAGMNPFGKLNLVEFSCTAWGINPSMGTPLNPWDMKTDRVPGGSSSGSGVAVAAGLLPAAIGSDTGGSIRVPASWNGTVGLKATFGRASAANIVNIVPSLDTIGPLTRSVEDAALMLQAITTDATCTDPLPSLRKSVKGLRLGIIARDQLGDVDPEVMAAVEAAAKVLAGQGAHVEEVRAPRTPPEYAATMATIFVAEAYTCLRDVVERGNFTQDRAAEARIILGKTVPASAYIEARNQQERERAEIRDWFADYDAVLLPTTTIAAMPVDTCDAMKPVPAMLTRWVNHLGLCAVAVPCGFNREGLPLSLQIVGKPFDEARILQVGWVFEQATEWHKRRPALS